MCARHLPVLMMGHTYRSRSSCTCMPSVYSQQIQQYEGRRKEASLKHLLRLSFPPRQVTMADRSAADRACKDPNPIIDGRKANVNLAYLGAKPRVMQPGSFSLFFRCLLRHVSRLLGHKFAAHVTEKCPGISGFCCIFIKMYSVSQVLPLAFPKFTLRSSKGLMGKD